METTTVDLLLLLCLSGCGLLLLAGLFVHSFLERTFRNDEYHDE